MKKEKGKKRGSGEVIQRGSSGFKVKAAAAKRNFCRGGGGKKGATAEVSSIWNGPYLAQRTATSVEVKVTGGSVGQRKSFPNFKSKEEEGGGSHSATISGLALEVAVTFSYYPRNYPEIGSRCSSVSKPPPLTSRWKRSTAGKLGKKGRKGR